MPIRQNFSHQNFAPYGIYATILKINITKVMTKKLTIQGHLKK